MAYIKYKELTKYYNFSKELKLNELPEYVYSYIETGEEILIAYSTHNDIFLLTTYKLIIFDTDDLNKEKQRIHFFPHISVSSTAIEFNKNKSSIFLTMDSGYQVQLNFIKMTKEEQEKIRKVYMTMIEVISKKRIIKNQNRIDF